MQALNPRPYLKLKTKQKLTVISVLSALMAFHMGPIAAKAADVIVDCSVSGSFTVTDSGGQLTAAKNGTTCVGIATVPDGVTKLGLFQNNSSLTKIVIPASVTSINQYAFTNCSNLAEVTFAANSRVTQIGPYTFNNTRLNAFEVPASVTEIGDNAFNTSRLGTLTFEAGSQLRTIGGGAFGGNNLTSVTLPESVVSLGSKAFLGNTLLTSFSFGANPQLTSIGEEAFGGMPQSTIALPASVTTIGNLPFGSNIRLTLSDSNPNFTIQNGVLFNKNRTTLLAYAPWLTDASYVIPETVTTLAAWSFVDSRLQSINIPSTVTSMGTYVFARTSQLREVTFSSNSAITRIPNAGFQAAAITQITIPASVTVLEGYSLNTSYLEAITFASNSALVDISNNVFQSAKLRSIEIPSSVQNIGDNAFSGNSLLTSVTFAPGSSLRYFGTNAVRNSPLTTFTLPSTPTRSGYRFTGWSNTSNGNVLPSPTTSALAGSALHAKWLQLSTVTFNSNSGSSVEAVSFSQGDTISAPVAPTRSGYAFEGWSRTNGGTAITLPFQTTTSASITLYANWREIPTITTGSVTNSQVVSIPSGLTVAEVPATSILPKVSLAFTATSSSAVVTLVPIDNPAAAAATPFMVTGTTKIVDIQVSGISGAVTVCLDGAPTDEIFHYTNGAWVALPDRSYVNGQVCGVTENFSPFAAAEPRALTPVASSGPTGPRLTLASRVAVTTNGQNLALKGVLLSDIYSVKLGGKDIKVIKQTDGELVVEVPAGAEGFPALELKHASGTLTYYRMIEIIKPYELTRSIKITKFVGSRPTLAGLSALYKVYQADRSVNLLTCVITVASDASGEAVALAESLGKSTCQRVVNYSRQIKNAQIVVKQDGAKGSKPVVEITFDRTLSAGRG